MSPEERSVRREGRRAERIENQVRVIEEAEAVIREAQGLPPYTFERPTPPPPLR